MTVLWRILRAIQDAIQALQENTAAVAENTAASAALSLQVKILSEELAQSELMADRAGDPVLSASVVNEP